jgi:triosephosphate isomerase
MAKRKIRTPFFVVNPKAYLYGDKSLELAVEADKLAAEADIDIIFTCQFVDVYPIKRATNNLILSAQHMDFLTPGAGMGHILPEGLKNAGYDATFLNHAEHPLTVAALTKCIKRADELDILTIVCADSTKDATAIATLHPDVMVCEQTELIGTGKTGDISYMRATNEAVRAVSKNTLLLQAAGISTVADVKKAIESGADGTGGTSGIVCADDPKQVMRDMVMAIKGSKS